MNDIVAQRGMALASLAGVAKGMNPGITLDFVHDYMEKIVDSISIPAPVKEEGVVIPLRIVSNDELTDE